MNTAKFSSKSTRVIAAVASMCTTLLLFLAVLSLADTTGVLPQMASATALKTLV